MELNSEICQNCCQCDISRNTTRPQKYIATRSNTRLTTNKTSLSQTTHFLNAGQNCTQSRPKRCVNSLIHDRRRRIRLSSKNDIATHAQDLNTPAPCCAGKKRSTSTEVCDGRRNVLSWRIRPYNMMVTVPLVCMVLMCSVLCVQVQGVNGGTISRSKRNIYYFMNSPTERIGMCRVQCLKMVSILCYYLIVLGLHVL